MRMTRKESYNQCRFSNFMKIKSWFKFIFEDERVNTIHFNYCSSLHETDRKTANKNSVSFHNVLVSGYLIWRYQTTISNYSRSENAEDKKIISRSSYREISKINFAKFPCRSKVGFNYCCLRSFTNYNINYVLWIFSIVTREQQQ